MHVIQESGTFEKFGGTEEFQKNVKSWKNKTFEKFGGTRGIYILSRKSGTFEKFGHTFVVTSMPTFVVKRIPILIVMSMSTFVVICPRW